MSLCDSTLGFFPRVEKILLIAFRAGNSAGADFHEFQAERLRKLAHRQNGLLPQSFTLHNSSGADLLARQFELRLDEDYEDSAGFCKLQYRLESLLHGDKRHVDRN